ncbi:MAG: hypothetical protein J0I43_15935 [Microbacterium sp.]|uniref:four-carbon acid sugar kinase family protein n=1 Tax=Microbacterium sp. TaxID=51671 RepID=UPI001ACA7FE0|nr:four-carbon acid sugar kinase family protein [Microbacterium sp.]MBN9178840.1 hypothetical protein [Microbacterium sp.]
MKTIILDDDPTGTQSATGARVLLRWDVATIADALREHDSVYLQTNSRALDEASAVALIQQIELDVEAAAARLGESTRYVLRGDSTLRGHVFAESDVLMADDGILVFVPAFPEGGRTTRGGVHYVRSAGVDVPAHETEYAHDPVFPFGTSVLVDYVAEKSHRHAIPVSLAQVRAGQLTEVLRSAPRGAVVVPDAENASDIASIARGIEEAWDAGVPLVVRSASPLAAELAAVTSTGLLSTPLAAAGQRVLVVCGSHTYGATAQIEAVAQRWGAPAVIDTGEALADPRAEGERVADSQRDRLARTGLAFIATARERSADHGTLDHGSRVMAALTTTVAMLLPSVDVIIAKGGITSADVARVGMGAVAADVLGQVLPGVSVWRMRVRDGRSVLYVVVPGNVGEADTLARVLEALPLLPAALTA